MKSAARRVQLVVAEDDEDDFLLTKGAFEKAGVTNELHWVKDGEELLAFLRERDDEGPLLILLDLNMPKMDGREVLKELQLDPGLCRIPVIVLTTSGLEEDINQSYTLGVSSYLKKPSDFEEMIEIAKSLKRFWLELAELPSRSASARPTA